MKKGSVFVATTLALLLTVVILAPAASARCGGGGGGGGCWGGGSGGSGGGTSLSQAEAYWLGHMRQEEKLARDVYLTMYDRWGDGVFSMIAMSEQRHTDAVEGLSDKYGLTDPVTNEAARDGFADPGLAALYDTLLARGQTSLHEAYLVGVDVETIDIADLETAIGASTHSDILNVYGCLLQGSHHHLSAFSSRL